MIREIPLRAGSREYTFRLGANALCRFEREAGMPIGKIAEQLGDAGNVEMRVVRALVWAGLKDRTPEMTLEIAGDLIDEIGLGTIMAQIQTALIAAFPPPAADANPLEAAGGNGRLS